VTASRAIEWLHFVDPQRLLVDFQPFEAAWNAQGLAFAVAMHGRVFVGERAAPGDLRPLDGLDAGMLAWSGCGRFLGVVAPGRARIVEVSTGRTTFDHAVDGRLMALWIEAGGRRARLIREEGPPFVPIVREHAV
jgi:hypothetical protein